MPRVTIELEIPGDLARFRLPRGVNARLQELLDRRDSGTPLTKAERLEAEGLVELAKRSRFCGCGPRRHPERPPIRSGDELDRTLRQAIPAEQRDGRRRRTGR